MAVKAVPKQLAVIRVSALDNYFVSILTSNFQTNVKAKIIYKTIFLQKR